MSEKLSKIDNSGKSTKGGAVMAEKKVVKVAVVGLSRGLSIAQGLVNNRNATISAVCDLMPERREAGIRFCEKNGYKDYEVFENYEQVLASDNVDAIILATDATIHTPMAIKALEAGKHVLSEIPAIHTIEDIKALRAATDAHPDVKYFCGENCCYWAFIDTWKKMHEDGQFGDIAYAESEYHHASEIVAPDAEEQGMFKTGWRRTLNAIEYLTHNLGPLLYIMEDRCVSVSCMVPDTVYNPYVSGQENGIALFKTEKGAVIRIFIGFGVYVGCDHNFSIYGTKGSSFTENTKHFAEAKTYAKLSSIPGTDMMPMQMQMTAKFPGEQSDSHGGADTKMVKDFISCIVNDTKPRVDIDLAINMALPGLIAVESAKRGGELIEIPKM